MFFEILCMVLLVLYGLCAWLVARQWLPDRVLKEREWHNYFSGRIGGEFSVKTELRFFRRRCVSYLVPLVLLETAPFSGYAWFVLWCVRRNALTESFAVDMLFPASVIWFLAGTFLTFPTFGMKMLFMKEEDKTG